MRDARVKVAIFGEQYSEASTIADVRSPGFKILERTIRQVFPDCIVAPYLVMATTDARHYQEISDCILRFLPTRMTPDDLKTIHGTNERDFDRELQGDHPILHAVDQEFGRNGLRVGAFPGSRRAREASIHRRDAEGAGQISFAIIFCRDEP